MNCIYKGCALFLLSALLLGGCAKPVWRATPPSTQLDNVLNRFHQGIQFIEQENSAKAVQIFTALTEEYPNVSVFYHNLGVAHKKAGNIDDAIESYRRSYSLKSRIPDSHYNLAIILREQGQFIEAEKEYYAALEISPDFGDAHYNLAIMYDLYMDRPAEAIQHYKSYLSLGGTDKDLVEIWMAGLMKRMEEREEAL